MSVPQKSKVEFEAAGNGGGGTENFMAEIEGVLEISGVTLDFGGLPRFGLTAGAVYESVSEILTSLRCLIS